MVDVILGIDWLRRQAAIWDFEAGCITLHGKTFKLQGSSTRSWCRRVFAQELIIVPALSEAMFPADVVYNDLHLRPSANECVWTTEVAKPKPGLRVS